MGKPLEEVRGHLNKLYELKDQAEADLFGAGRRLKQPIIERARALTQARGDFSVTSPEGSGREQIEYHKSEQRRIKAEAEEIRRWADRELPD